jgi:hypothetical protein
MHEYVKELNESVDIVGNDLVPMFDRSVIAQLVDGVFDADLGHTSSGIDGVLDDIAADSAYPADVQRYAFGLWCFEAGEDCERVAGLVRDRASVSIHARHVRRWRDTQDWPRVAAEVRSGVVHKSGDMVRSMVAVGMVKAMQWALTVFDNPLVKDSVKVAMARAMWDRGGLPAHVRGEVMFGGMLHGGDLADLDDTALDDVIRRYGGGGEDG